jgi:hypothetical protein
MIIEPTKVFSQSHDMAARLATYAFPPVSVFVRALSEGQFLRINTTSNDIPTVPGLNAWHRTSRVLRDAGGDYDFIKIDNPIPGIIRKRDSAMIVVVSGNPGTGREDCENPRTKNPRKHAWVNAIGKYHDANLFTTAGVEDPMHNFWILLIHSNDSGELLAELSKPLGVDADNHISRYSERIIFGKINLGGQPVAQDFPTALMSPIDVPVTRKNLAVS